MSHRHGLTQACLVGAVLAGPLLLSTEALAQNACCQGGSATGANMWTDGLLTSDQWPAPAAPVTNAGSPDKAAAPAVPYWWTHGEIEFGGQDFTNNPPRNGAVYLGQQSLAKYYEYGIVPPGAFGGGHVAVGSIDGLYQADLWANNVGSFEPTNMSNLRGFSDQSYLLDLSKVGEQYLTLQWDQTPHVYSTSAETPYLGVGSNNLTLPPGALKPFTSTATPGSFLTPFLHQQDIGIERDTASVDYRWTPTDDWDLRADYSNTSRTGTLVQGFTGSVPGAPASSTLHNEMITEVPEPVNDNTQNFGANGEYAGISPWGKYTFKTAYTGSIYTDNISSYSVENPWSNPCGPTSQACPTSQISTWPSNQANGVSGVLAADLPAKSRYVGTLSYELMTQNDTFLPMTNNPNAALSPTLGFGGIPWNQVNFGFINGNLSDPTSSLDGKIGTLLSNNTLVTHITSDVTSKLSYRYYDFDNETPQVVFPAWVSYDQVGNSSLTAPTEKSISSLTMSYIKQNGGAELNWEPSKQWIFNGALGWERYDYTETDVNTTNEYTGKLSADWKPTSWLTARVSGSYGQRRYDVYDYIDFVRDIQFPTVPGYTAGPESGAWYYSTAYQQFMFDNRNRTQANFLLDLVAFSGVTLTPSIKYNDDYYGLNPLNQYGLSDSRSVSTGGDVAWVVNPHLSITLSYYWQDYDQLLYNQPTPASAFTTLVSTPDKTYVNTVTAAIRYVAIPGKLNLDARYELSDGIDEQNCTGCTQVTGFPSAYPNDTTLWQRLDLTATYKFDPSWFAQTGFKGDIKAKLRYTWERNAVSNWQNDSVAPFNPAINSGYGIYLGYDNPNYNIQMIGVSLIASW
jgi:hypothetical protein